MRCIVLALLLSAAAMAQSESLATVSGAVRDSDTGQPLPGARVYLVLPQNKVLSSNTDAAGHYTLSDVPAGAHRIIAQSDQTTGQVSIAMRERAINVKPGETLDSVDFRLMSRGSIEGTLLDENKNPIPRFPVMLVEKIYDNGELRQTLAGKTDTDADGAFRLEGLPAGQPYLLAVQALASSKQDAPGDTDNLKSPQTSPATTFYPHTAMAEAAEEIVLGPGEARRVTLIQAQAPAYCAEGKIEDVGDDKYTIMVADSKATNGRSFMPTVNAGQTGSQGQFRVCNLHRGEFQFTFIKPSGSDLALEQTSVFISRQSLKDLKVFRHTKVPLTLELTWDDDTSGKLAKSALFQLTGPKQTLSGSAQTGKFVLPDYTPGMYSLKAGRLPPGCYLKNVTYANRSFPAGRIELSESGAPLQLTFGHDGATLTVAAFDHDATPVADANIALAPAGVSSTAELAAALIIGQTDQSGLWTSATLAPGKYFALATNDRIDMTSLRMSKLWSAWSRAKEIDVGPNGSVQVKLEPVSIQ